MHPPATRRRIVLYNGWTGSEIFGLQDVCNAHRGGDVYDAGHSDLWCSNIKRLRREMGSVHGAVLLIPFLHQS
jgi:hypothetical protein